MRRTGQLATFGCGAIALLAATPAAGPATGRSTSPTFSFTVAPMLPPAVVGKPYPPKPYPGVSFCNPAPKPGGTCGGPGAGFQANPRGAGKGTIYAFTVKAGHGLPPGLVLNARSGAISGAPKAKDAVVQQPGVAPPGLYPFAICAGTQGKHVCKPTKIAVFSGYDGTWTGSYQGDPGAFTCNIPLAGDITITLSQKVTYAKNVPESSLVGTAKLTKLPPISADGMQNGSCDESTQVFGMTGGLAKNPAATGQDSARGIWNATVDSSGQMTGTLTVQDTGSNGFYSQISFTAFHG
jgi:hypothetical protein